MGFHPTGPVPGITSPLRRSENLSSRGRSGAGEFPPATPTPRLRHAGGTSKPQDDRSASTPTGCRIMAEQEATIPRPKALPTTTPGHGGHTNEARPAKRTNPAVGLEAGGGVRRQVGHTGFEPVTSCVSYKRASQLRQWPEVPSEDGKSEDSRAVADRQGGGSSESRLDPPMATPRRPASHFLQRSPARS